MHFAKYATDYWVAIFFILLALIVGIVLMAISEKPAAPKDGYYQMRVFVYDGCEYLSFNNALVHKGNCTNNIHIYATSKISKN